MTCRHLNDSKGKIRRHLGWLLLAAPGLAAAHLEGGATAGLIHGLIHPVSGLDHVVAMLAVGLWAAQLGRPAVWLLPITFPVVMAIGGAMGYAGVPLPGIEIGIALSGVVLGGLVLSETKLRIPAAFALVGLFAIFHGYAHGAELPIGNNGALYGIGFMVATSLLHMAGIAVGLIHRWAAGRLAMRVAGGAVAGTGAVFLASALQVF